ncbi:hypothetical protein C0J52_25390 [Blattella germanica]|nr:hypothetical protein C0J52_25390 [Blattella germanica]
MESKCGILINEYSAKIKELQLINLKQGCPILRQIPVSKPNYYCRYVLKLQHNQTLIRRLQVELFWCLEEEGIAWNGAVRWSTVVSGLKS